ncbi:hypothetical protein BTO06_09920 [Tenacibaculum sp. SZ-18]|uniref:hypothetical protein n=1 Tax=Tenacibaculum sp. SZ-18 TaxID=754423 RepID=UPI000C2D4658|nr:hypothetical protein [Tenacibaculum sp. SZ-18]AUC15437.1 hypothetical protein BTO06_09920 [Tenacibaculum sp. SZ-18]
MLEKDVTYKFTSATSNESFPVRIVLEKSEFSSSENGHSGNFDFLVSRVAPIGVPKRDEFFCIKEELSELS